MLNEWSTKVPAHRRYELLSVGALMIFIFFGGISLTILLLLMLVRDDGGIILFQSLIVNHLIISCALSRFMVTFTCECCASHIWFSIILILIHRITEVEELGKNKTLFSSFFRFSAITFLTRLFLYQFFRCEWVRDWRIWKYVIDYFPVDLVKTVDLSPDRHYVIGTCPHGILWYVDEKAKVTFLYDQEK